MGGRTAEHPSDLAQELTGILAEEQGRGSPCVRAGYSCSLHWRDSAFAGLARRGLGPRMQQFVTLGDLGSCRFPLLGS